jgi:hypothetical protein
VIQCPNNF